MPVLKNAGHVGKIAKRVADANETLTLLSNGYLGRVFGRQRDGLCLWRVDREPTRSPRDPFRSAESEPAGRLPNGHPCSREFVVGQRWLNRKSGVAAEREPQQIFVY
jgi:hypothetical protein